MEEKKKIEIKIRKLEKLETTYGNRATGTTLASTFYIA